MEYEDCIERALSMLSWLYRDLGLLCKKSQDCFIRLRMHMSSAGNHAGRGLGLARQALTTAFFSAFPSSVLLPYGLGFCFVFVVPDRISCSQSDLELPNVLLLPPKWDYRLKI